MLRAGAVADAETVFGARQPGVRVVTIDPTRNAAGGAGSGGDAPSGVGSDGPVQPGPGRPGPGRPGPGYTEDGGHPLPAPAVEQAICTTGHTPVTVDVHGNPLDVGREQRLFTPKQRIALAIRDGGCRWRGCGMPASYCEAHHIDTWATHGGRTDIDRGILLCRFHHMNLHHHRYRITRDRHGPFLLHPPDSSEPTELPTRS
ncbi:HNH endonuclease signature motif containing protein, partial [Microbacterium petrolearium]